MMNNMRILYSALLLSSLIIAQVEDAAAFSVVLPEQRSLPTSCSVGRRQHALFSTRRRRRDYYDEYDDEEEEEEVYKDLPAQRKPRLRKEAELTERVVSRKPVNGVMEDEEEDEEFLNEEDEEMDDSDIAPTAGRRRKPSDSRNIKNRRWRGDFDERDDDEFFEEEEEEEEYDDLDYDYDYDDDDYDDMPSSGGNLWSNPTGGMDRPPRGLRDRDLTRPRMVDVPRRGDRPQREYDGRPDYFVNDSRRTPRRGPEWRSPVRTGQQKPPKLIEDIYNRLFFYGFDVDDNLDVGDKTVFGGTKGKFNGLKYLAAAEGRDPARYNKRRRAGPRPRSSRGGLPPARDDDYEFDEEEDYLFDNDEDSNPSEQYSLEESSDPYPSQSVRKRYSRRMTRGRAPSNPRRRPRYEDDGGDDYAGAGNDWVSEQVSAWFSDEDGGDELGSSNGGGDQYDDDDKPMSRRSRRRQRQRGRAGGNEWTPMNMIDSFFRIDRDEMAYKAAEYDAKMGLRRSKTRRQDGAATERRRSPRREVRKPEVLPRETPRRAGYAYKYDASLDEDDSPTILDIDVTIEEEPASEKDELGLEEKTEDISNEKKDSTRSKKDEKSWEERQAAVERVPPAEIPAWGPKGELPISARQKAIEDALKDIQMAKRKLNERVKKEIKARDEIAILNVDAKAQRLKIEQSRRGGPRYGTERLRQMELEIDEASRQLRRARKRVDIARDELEELEDRHYAVLSYYSPDQANRVIGEALDEFTVQVDSNPTTSVQVESSGSESAANESNDSDGIETGFEKIFIMSQISADRKYKIEGLVQYTTKEDELVRPAANNLSVKQQRRQRSISLNIPTNGVSFQS